MRNGLILALVLIGVTACTGKSAPQGSGGMPATAVETANVETRAISDSLQTVGSLRAVESVMIRPEVAGKLVHIHISEGQLVRQGALLFRLDAEIAQADYNEALANTQSSKRNYQRASQLASGQLISKVDYEAAQNTYAVNAAKAASAKARLDKMEIRAPFDGVVGLRQVSVGEFVGAGQALVDLVRLNPLEVEFQVPEAQVAKLHAGQTVRVSTEALPGQYVSATVSAVAPAVQTSSRSAAIRARLDNASNTLRPGQFAQVNVELSKAEPGLVIPEQAIWPSGDQKMVYVVSNGKVALVPVTLGTRMPGWVVVRSGVRAGDVVVTAGQMKLFPGASVSIVPTASAKMP